MKDIMVTSWDFYLGFFFWSHDSRFKIDRDVSIGPPCRPAALHQTYHGVDVLRVASSITVPRLLGYREYDSHHSKCFYHRLQHLITKPSFIFVFNEETTSEIKSTVVLSY